MPDSQIFVSLQALFIERVCLIKNKNKLINPRKKKLNLRDFSPQNRSVKNNFLCHPFKISGRRRRRRLHEKILKIKLSKQ